LEFSFWAIFLGGSDLIPFIRRRQAMGEDVYLKLREFMNTLPAGYPSTPSGVEIRILKKLFSPEEAELTMQLKSEPEEVPAIAARLGMDEAELAEQLEKMAQQSDSGAVHPLHEGPLFPMV
jgi:hypothetical protein